MDKRDLILNATADLIAENGLQSSPMSMIAKVAGCGAGTIYRYFETKDELVQQLYVDLAEKMTQACLTGYDQDTCIKLRFQTFWENFYVYMRENPRDCGLMEQMSACPAIDDEFRDTSHSQLLDASFKIFEDGKREKIIKDLPNQTLKAFVYGSLATIAKKYNICPESMGGEIDHESLLGMCWDAVKA